MDIRFTRPTLYTSHPIRGASGDIQGNCKKALACAKRMAQTFPEVDFYVPAAGDLTLQLLSSDNRLSVEDIMWADLQILKACHGYIKLSWEPSKGCDIEQTKARALSLPNEEVQDDLSKASYGVIRRRLNRVVRQAVKRFRSQ